MFTTAVGTKDGSSRFFRLTVAVSIALHVAGGAAFLVASFWKIAKLNPKGQELVFRSTLPSEGSSAPAAAPSTPEKGKIDHGPERQVRPDASHAVASDTPAANPAATPGGGTPGGIGNGPGGGGEGIDHAVGVPDVGTDPVDIPPPPKLPPPTQELAQEQIEGQRVSGDPKIYLPDGVLAMLRGQGVDRLRVVVQLCVDEAGRPSSIVFTPPTGYAQVEAAIRGEMNRWRYRPWVVDGLAARACFPVIFQYRITD